MSQVELTQLRKRRNSFALCKSKDLALYSRVLQPKHTDDHIVTARYRSESDTTMSENTVVEPVEYREDNKKWSIEPVLSSSNTDYGGEDPAKIDPPSGTPAELAVFEREEPPTEVEA